MYEVGHGSHIRMLLKCLEKTDGDVLELGMGMSSTNFLHWYCDLHNRKLVSYENDKSYYNTFKNFQTSLHEVNFVEDWDSINLNKKWSVALVDHLPKLRRREEIKRLADNTTFIVVHDTQPKKERMYRFLNVFSTFKYVIHDTVNPRTTVLSNYEML